MYFLFSFKVNCNRKIQKTNKQLYFVINARPIGSRLSESSINNGNRTSCRPIRSVIIRVINKTGRPRSGSPICLITSMITDRIGRHEVLSPINQSITKLEKEKGENVLEKELTTVSRYVKRTYSSVTDPLERVL